MLTKGRHYPQTRSESLGGGEYLDVRLVAESELDYGQCDATGWADPVIPYATVVRFTKI